MSKKAKPQKWTKEEIRAKLASDDRWLVRGLLAIYGYQTPDEQTVGVTVEDNGLGFNGADAEILTSFAVSYGHYGRLTEKQLEVARKKMLKYAGQLATHANTHHPKESKE